MSNKMFFAPFGGGVVENGLLMHVDASNVLSYDNSVGGTNWNDLTSNNNDATLYNNPLFVNENGGVFSFHSNSMSAFTSSLPSDLLGNPQFTVSGWFKRNSNNNDVSTWGFGLGLNSFSPSNINSYMTVNNEISISLSNTCIFGADEYYSTAIYKHVTWVKRFGVFSRNNIDIYVNGVKKTGSSLINRYGNETTNANILAGNGIAISKTYATNDNYQRANLRVADFYVYNRAISEEENLINFNNSKTKFGY